MRMYAPSQATLPHAYRVVRIQLIRVRNEGVNVNVNVNVNSLLVLCTGVYTIWYLVTGCVLADHLPGRRGNQDGPPATAILCRTQSLENPPVPCGFTCVCRKCEFAHVHTCLGTAILVATFAV